MLRGNKLDCFVYMRSNDLWLGFPYDVFNFSMLSHLICCRLNDGKADGYVEPGAMHHTAASRHIYEEHFLQAKMISDGYNTLEMPIEALAGISTKETPLELYTSENVLMQTLDAIRTDGKNSSAIWWN